MPELPDITLYIERLSAHTAGQRLSAVKIQSPFFLRSVEPKITELNGRVVQGFRRLGKRITFDFGDELYAVIHLMIAGRMRWRKAGSVASGKNALATFIFEHGSLWLTEASTQKRASLHVVRGEDELARHQPGGLEPLQANSRTFAEALLSQNRTLKRALTDPRIFSGIGNAYSDEILFDARLSPMKLTGSLEPDEVERLFVSTQSVLTDWLERFRVEVGDGFPEKVTAFRPEMKVHGKYKEPCVVCGKPIQRIRYAANECNYCAKCQNAGRLLADRSLSRLLKKDWPRTLEELEQLRGERA
ncbi:MAG: DNA-formamidopyrimidine glycosylase family protein [Myxococcota bacterium]